LAWFSSTLTENPRFLRREVYLACRPVFFLQGRKRKTKSGRTSESSGGRIERTVQEVLSAWKREKSREARECERAVRRISRISRVKVTEISTGQTKLGTR